MHIRQQLLIILLLLSPTLLCQTHSPFRLVSWNVENLFDTCHDEGFQDHEFLPEGKRQWTSGRFWKKVNDVARVIVAIGEDGIMPNIIGLCEVENDSVMHALTRRSLLRHIGYDYVMTHSSDTRGIDVALLYNPQHFQLLSHYSIVVKNYLGSQSPTRDILYVQGTYLRDHAIDTLHVFVVHLPSLLGGHRGDRLRRQASLTLWEAVDSVERCSPSPIVVMGDFNGDARSHALRRAPLMLTDAPDVLGTYCFRGHWEWLDHILISPSLSPLSPAKPIMLPWLVESNATHDVLMPFRTYRGSTYHGGISDHLPLMLDLPTTSITSP